MTEQFRDIPGFEGIYMVSPSGRVLSLYTGKIRKPYKDKKCGYWRLSLLKDGKYYTIEVHRLVAMAWLEKPEGATEIDHIDGNKDNNCVDNLEWVSHSENMQRS